VGRKTESRPDESEWVIVRVRGREEENWRYGLLTLSVPLIER
jgi:hypothetical protein